MLLFGYRCQAVAVVIFLAGYSAAQIDNPILQPQPGDVLTAGTTYNIIWAPTTGDLISIELWNGFSIASSFDGSNCNVDSNSPLCSQIIQNVSNSGSFLWTIPINAPVSDSYFLDIYVPDPGLGGPFYYMTGNFSIQIASSVTTTASITTSQRTSSSSSIAKPNVMATSTASIRMSLSL